MGFLKSIFGLIGGLIKTILGVFGIGKKSEFFMELDEGDSESAAPAAAPAPAPAAKAPEAAPAQKQKHPPHPLPKHPWLSPPPRLPSLLSPLLRCPALLPTISVGQPCPAAAAPAPAFPLHGYGQAGQGPLGFKVGLQLG